MMTCGQKQPNQKILHCLGWESPNRGTQLYTAGRHEESLGLVLVFGENESRKRVSFEIRKSEEGDAEPASHSSVVFLAGLLQSCLLRTETHPGLTSIPCDVGLFNPTHSLWVVILSEKLGEALAPFVEGFCPGVIAHVVARNRPKYTLVL